MSLEFGIKVYIDIDPRKNTLCNLAQQYNNRAKAAI